MNVLSLFKTLGLFFLTAIFEILACYFPYLILNQNKSYWLIIPTILFLILFVWSLTLHPQASGKIYAMYGGIYICTALLWLKFVDKIELTFWDLMGGVIIFIGALLMIVQPNFKINT